MTEMMCRYSGDRDQAIVSYLYGDDGGFDPAERAAFEAHLPTCRRCRTELAAFKDVRASLGRWSPPGLGLESPPSVGAARPKTLDASPRSSWREIPAWAQVAAALLCLGVGAGIANLDVRYGDNGLQVRTGWSTAAPAAAGSQPTGDSAGAGAPWRAELAALEGRLRSEVRQASVNATNATNITGSPGNLSNAGNPANADVLRRVRTLVDDSERRQQRELALRLGEALRELNVQRQADLVRIDSNIGAMQNNTGREMLRQRNDMLNYVTLRTAGQRPQ